MTGAMHNAQDAGRTDGYDGEAPLALSRRQQDGGALTDFVIVQLDLTLLNGQQAALSIVERYRQGTAILEDAIGEQAEVSVNMKA